MAGYLTAPVIISPRLPLLQTYQVAYLVLKAANSPRPGNWILERSVDGEVYQAWQYFAVSDSECKTVYGVNASSGLHDYTSDTQVTCTSYYSKIQPRENGEVGIVIS